MRSYGLPHCGEFIVSDPKVPAGILYNLTDRRIMHVADTGKQMMFHLEVQSTNIPGNKFITRREIGRGLYLVNFPFFLYLFSVVLRYIDELSVFYHMRQLEYQGKSQSHGD